MSATMTAAECAALLRISTDRFYRTRIARERAGMPAPVSPIGRPRWDRGTFLAWLGLNHPNAPQLRAANDTSAPVTPANDRQWRHAFQRHYGANP